MRDLDDLERSARRYEALDASSGSIVWVVDPQLRPAGRNENWERYTGQQPGEYSEYGWMQAVHPQDRERFRALAVHALESEEPLTIELGIRRADGEYRRNLIRAVPVKSGDRVVEWIGTATDIEDARQTADSLSAALAEQRDLRARLLALTDGAERLLGMLDAEQARAEVIELARRVLPADGYAIWTLDTERQEWSVVCSAGLPAGFVAIRIPGEPVKFMKPLSIPDLLLEGDGSVRREAYTEAGIRSLLAVPLPIHGERRTTLVLYYGERHEASETELRVGIALGQLSAATLGNVEAYVAQTRMREEAERHASRMASLANDNARLLAEAEAANKAKDEFLALLSHELRTPLNAIMGWAYMLREGLPEEMRKHAVEVICRNGSAQKQLVEDLLDVARIAGGKVDLDAGFVDVHEIAKAAVDAALPAARQKNVSLSLATPNYPIVVSADAHRLQQVTANLLSNALKFTENGGRVTLSVSRRDEHVEMLVTDDGIGMAPEFLPYAFERFRQADTSLTRTHGGLGLGLWVVKRIVEAHGGIVQAESDGLRKGTTIRVQLPLGGTPPVGERQEPV